MDSLYEMAARVSLDVTGMMGPGMAAFPMMNRLHAQAGFTTTQIDKLGAAFKTFAAGTAITGVGVGLAALMGDAVKRAEALQTIVIGIQTRTGASAMQMAALQTRATTIGLTNQMSTTDVMGIAQSASRAGITDIGQLSQMLKPLSNYSEVMLRATGADPAHSATIAAEMAHLYGAFGTKQIGGVSDTAYLVNQLGKAMQIVPGSQDQFLHLLSQFVGTERPLYKGKPPQALISDTISEATLLSQMGQGTRGGNQIARIITNMMGGARGKTALDAIAGIQRGTGIHFANAQGQINDPSLLLKALATTAQKLNPQQTLAQFSRAFAANGARLAGLFADPIVGTRLKAIADAMKAMPDLGAQQRRYNASAQGQFNQANKNFDSAMTQLGILWLPLAVRAANALAAFTAGVVRFSQQNPKLMEFIATFVAVTATVSLVAGPFLMLAGAVGAVLAVFGVAGLAPVLAAILAIGAALAGVTWVILHWKDIMGFVAGSFDALGAAAHRLLVILGLAHDPVQHYKTVKAPPVAANSIVRTTIPTGGTVGMPTYLYIKPLPQPAPSTSTPPSTHKPGHTGGGGSIYDMMAMLTELHVAHPVAATPAHARAHMPASPFPVTHPVVPVVPIVQTASMAYVAPVVHTTPVHAYHETVTHHRGAAWDMPDIGPSSRSAHGAAPVYHLHVAPGAVGPIHVHGADHHDEEALAKRVGAHVIRDLGDELVHTLTSGAPSVFGLSPVLNTPAPR